jgi:hypothetical protein
MGVFDEGVTFTIPNEHPPKSDQCIAHCLEDENYWIQACAIHAVADGHFLHLIPAVEGLLGSPSFICRETAMTTLYRLKKEQLKKYREMLLSDNHPKIRAMAQGFFGVTVC